MNRIILSVEEHVGFAAVWLIHANDVAARGNRGFRIRGRFFGGVFAVS